MESILLIADYFGRWPVWFPLFLASCAANPTVRWLIHTDCPPPDQPPSNVMFRPMAASTYCARVSERLGITFQPQSMYAVTNIRPAFGEIHAEEITGYDYYGWCDIDVVFGDLRRFLGNEVLGRNVISMSDEICTGHLTLLRNTPDLRALHRHIPDWRVRMGVPGAVAWSDCLDEAWVSRLCSPKASFRGEAAAAGVPEVVLNRLRQNNHFEEQWVTPFAPWPWLDGDRLHPEVWYWRPGSLTNWRDGDREFPYLHLMNFKARRYVDEALYGLTPTWDVLPVSCPDMAVSSGVRIDRWGLSAVSPAAIEAERARLGALARAKTVDPPADADLAQIVAAVAARGARLDDGLLDDPAGVVSPALRARLWRERAPGSRTPEGGEERISGGRA